MINVTDHIQKFRKFLLDCWADLDSLLENHDWDNDQYLTLEWIQSNWEFLVERQLLKKGSYLSCIGFSHQEKRIMFPNVKVTHEIVCLSKRDDFFVDDESKIIIPRDCRLIFKGFLKKMDGSYGLYPPFDYAFVRAEGRDRKSYYTILLDDINFFLDRCESDMKVEKSPL